MQKSTKKLDNRILQYRNISVRQEMHVLSRNSKNKTIILFHNLPKKKSRLKAGFMCRKKDKNIRRKK